MTGHSVGGIRLSLQGFNTKSLLTVVFAIQVLEKGVRHNRANTCCIKCSSTTAKTLIGTQINSRTIWSLRDVEMYQKTAKRYKVIQLG